MHEEKKISIGFA